VTFVSLLSYEKLTKRLLFPFFVFFSLLFLNIGIPPFCAWWLLLLLYAAGGMLSVLKNRLNNAIAATCRQSLTAVLDK
jgi:hypothetical protein